MKILVTGVKGQLGFDVVNELEQRGHTAIGVDIEEMDITNKESVNTVIHGANPDGVIHCAAWTAVDAAEEEENKEKVMAVNASGTRYIAEVCKDLAIPMMYISTDYIFDGQGETPWTPDQQNYAPLNVYGASKLAGEQAVKELRAIGITVIVHTILYLPGETKDDMLDTIHYLNHMDIQGIKLQLLHVLTHTDLAADYEKHPFYIPDMQDYIQFLGTCIAQLNPEIVIHRLTGDGPKDLLIAPLWTSNKRTVLNQLHSHLKEQDIWQGKEYYV